jgi:hypothetical protein
MYPLGISVYITAGKRVAARMALEY